VDLLRLIDLTGLTRPIVAGQSWGAGLVLDLAVRQPGLVRGIVAVDGGLNDLRDGFPDFDACWDRLAPPMLTGHPLFEVEGYFRTAHADWPEEGIAGSLANFEIRPDATIAPWLSRDNHKRILRAMWDQRTGELWRELRVPALIAPVEDQGSGWADAKRTGATAAYLALSHSGTPVRLQWFSGDHDIHVQRPAELAAAMLEATRAGLFGGVRTV
jgi:pimeloyl-ACP methyl ester carboxylesterase